MEQRAYRSIRNPVFVCMFAMLFYSDLTKAQEKSIEEIVVSVRRSDENIQDVPIQVTVFNDQIIQSEQLSTLADVAALTPSMQFETGL